MSVYTGSPGTNDGTRFADAAMQSAQTQKQADAKTIATQYETIKALSAKVAQLEQDHTNLLARNISMSVTVEEQRRRLVELVKIVREITLLRTNPRSVWISDLVDKAIEAMAKE